MNRIIAIHKKEVGKRRNARLIKNDFITPDELIP
jgi:hypothetical protein